MDEFLHHALGLPRYDRVAAPGGPACIAGHAVAIRDQGAMEKQLRFLITAHELNRVVFIAHQDCGFYKHLKLWGKTIEEQQRRDMAKSAELVRTYGEGLTVEAYFAPRLTGKCDSSASRCERPDRARSSCKAAQKDLQQNPRRRFFRVVFRGKSPSSDDCPADR